MGAVSYRCRVYTINPRETEVRWCASLSPVTVGENTVFGEIGLCQLSGVSLTGSGGTSTSGSVAHGPTIPATAEYG